MLRNDYRRALIMLRSVEQGYAGHARLERRTLTGTLCFTASAPGAAALRAALVGRRAGDYFAAPLGRLRRDSRGQYGLIASFDPRNIEGRELEKYALAVVVDEGAGCRLVLTGNLAGSVEMDWARVQACLCALTEAEAQQGAADGDATTQAADGDASAQEAPTQVASWDAPAQEVPTQVSGWDAPAQEAPSQAAGWDAPAQEAPAQVASWDAPAQEAPSQEQAAGAGAADCAEALTPEGAFPDALGQTPAAEQASIDAAAQWPEAFESVRPLFAASEPMEDPPLAGYVFVRDAMPQDSGFAFVAIGVRVEDGVPARLAYAYPGQRSPTPPAGLEDCLWLGGDGQGWWVRFSEP